VKQEAYWFWTMGSSQGASIILFIRFSVSDMEGGGFYGDRAAELCKEGW